MTSVIRIVYSHDGSDIKDDVIRRIKEGQEELDHIQTCSLSDRLARGSDGINNTDVNILILTPSLCSEINKYPDYDFKVLFPNLEKSLLLVCDTESELIVRSVISKSVEYSKIRQFQISNTMEWKYMMVPTIKQMTSPEEEEPSIPDINRYVIKPKRVDSSVDEVCVVFLDAVELQESVEVTIGDKRIPTKQLTKSVYIFSPEDLPSGTHKVTVTSAGKDFGTTTIEVESDIDRFIEFLHKTVRYDAITLLAKLLRTHTDSKEDVESELVDIIAETSHSPPFLRLLENLVQLEPKAERRSVVQESHMDSMYPSLLHLCAANGLTSVCDWLLDRYNTEDKRSWKNRDGHTPADLAANHNHTELKELLEPRSDIPPPLGNREHMSFDLDSDDEENVFLPSPVSSNTLLRPKVSHLLDRPLHQQRSKSCSERLLTGYFNTGMRCISDPGRDSGWLSGSGSRGCSVSSMTSQRKQSVGDMSNWSPWNKGNMKKERIYDGIDAVESPASHDSEGYNFKKKYHLYTEPDEPLAVPKIEIKHQTESSRVEGLNTISESVVTQPKDSETCSRHPTNQPQTSNMAGTRANPKSEESKLRPLLRHTSTKDTKL